MIKLSDSENRSLTMPLLPSTISVSESANTVTQTVITGDEVSYTRGSQASIISFDGLLPGTRRSGINRQSSVSASEARALMRTWLKANTQLTATIDEAGIAGATVTMTKISWTYEGAFSDVAYSLELMVLGDGDGSGSGNVGTTETEQRTYTAVIGDTPWSVARKAYGNGKRWREIFNANMDAFQTSDGVGKDVIPGTIIIIPD